MSAIQQSQLANVQLNEHIIWKISQWLESPRWITVGRQLKMSHSTLEEINKLYKVYRECAFRMLMVWHEEYPKYTLNYLFTALQEINWNKPIEDITECLGKEVVVPSQPASTLDLPNSIGKIELSTEKISKGGRGTEVYKGTYEGRKAAIKKVPLQLISFAENEIQILHEADRHPNIITYYGQEQDSTHCYMALELCRCNLADFCTKEHLLHVRRPKSDKSLLREITDGLNYLHKAGTIHRNIHPENILISLPDCMGQFKAVISDFGFSKKIPEAKTHAHSAKRGTGGWVAVELIRNTGEVTNAVDVFSLGCIYYYVITSGEQIFYSDHDVANRPPEINHLKPGRDILIKKLIKKMINRNPSCRPKCKDILKDIYFWDQKEVLYFIKNVDELLRSCKVEQEKSLELCKHSLSILNMNSDLTSDPIEQGQYFKQVKDIIHDISITNPSSDNAMKEFTQKLLKYPKLFLHLHSVFANYQPSKSLRPRLTSISFRKIQETPAISKPVIDKLSTPSSVKSNMPTQETVLNKSVESPLKTSIPHQPPISNQKASVYAHAAPHPVKPLGIIPTKACLQMNSPHARQSKTYTKLCAIDAHTDAIHHVSISNDGKMISTCSFDKYVKLWKTGRKIFLNKKNTIDFNWKQVYSSQFNTNDTELLVSGMNNTSLGEVIILTVKDGFQHICCVRNDIVLINAWQSESFFLTGEKTEQNNGKNCEIVLNNLQKLKSSLPSSPKVWTYYTNEEIQIAGIIQRTPQQQLLNDGYLVYTKGQSICAKTLNVTYANVSSRRGYASLRSKPSYDKPDMTIDCAGVIHNIAVYETQRCIYATIMTPTGRHEITEFQLTNGIQKSMTIELQQEYKASDQLFLAISKGLIVVAAKEGYYMKTWNKESKKLESLTAVDGGIQSVAINPADGEMLVIGSKMKLTQWKLQKAATVQK